MLSLRDSRKREAIPISVAAGDMIRVGFVLSATDEMFTRIRVLVVGDLLRRVLEDVHSAQVLALLITDERGAADDEWRAEFMVRPMAGIYRDLTAAEADLGRSVDLVIAADKSPGRLTLGQPLMQVPLYTRSSCQLRTR